MLMFFMLLINLLFLNFNNPLIMGFMMMIQILLLIMIMGKIYYSFWFSYIVFLVFIGGLFILFIYIISLIYNNKFYFMKKMNYLLFSMTMLLTMKYKILFFFNYETMLFDYYHILKDNYLYTFKLYNTPNNSINLFLIIYLLLMMIMVVKITNFSMGPIRSMN